MDGITLAIIIVCGVIVVTGIVCFTIWKMWKEIGKNFE